MEQTLIQTRFTHNDHETAHLYADPLPPAIGIIGLGAVAAIHLSQVVSTTEETPLLGAAFMGLITGSIILAALLLHHRGWRLWATVATVNTLAIVGYVFTRVISTPFDDGDVGNWSEALGLTALFVEGALVLLSLHLNLRIAGRGSRSPRSPPCGGAASCPP